MLRLCLSVQPLATAYRRDGGVLDAHGWISLWNVVVPNLLRMSWLAGITATCHSQGYNAPHSLHFLQITAGTSTNFTSVGTNDLNIAFVYGAMITTICV